MSGSLEAKTVLKGYREHDNHDRQERSVICVPGVTSDVELDKALNNAATHEGNASKIGLPADGAEPT